MEIKDDRLVHLAEISKSKKVLYAHMKFIDIAGLVKGASKGEGLGNKFLANIREVDAIVHVVRCFDDDDIVHVTGAVDPIDDIETINLELILADLQMAENSLSKIERQAKSDKTFAERVVVIKKAIEALNQNKVLRSIDFTPEEAAILNEYS